MNKMKKSDIIACSFCNWYPLFKDVTIRSCIIPLSAEFLDYLLSDGIVLPESSISGPTSLVNQAGLGEDNGDDEAGLGEDNGDDEAGLGEDNGDDDVDWDTDEASDSPSFPQFEDRIKECMKMLGGEIFPKLNWSSPKDAAWISFDRSLKCVCPADIYLLLKSSDFVTHDLTEPFLKCEDFSQTDKAEVQYDLVLRKWVHLNTGMEFRCFVKNKQLIAVSQRDCEQYYPFISPMKNKIVSGIQTLYNNTIVGKFPLDNFVFDVYRRSETSFWIIDFNPFGPITDSLMYSWDELNGLSEESLTQVEFRCVEAQTAVKSSPFSSNSVPQDVSNINNPEDFEELLSMLQSMPQTHSDSDTD